MTRNNSIFLSALVALALTACPPPPPKPVCGNGAVEDGETCDDGNTAGGDGCEADCTPTVVGNVCGDGTRSGTEACDDGNTTGGDGCEADCTQSPQSQVVNCANAPTAPAAGCDVTPGDNGRLITGVVLAPSTVYVGGQVLVDSMGTIACVGCDCSATAGASSATRLVCPNTVVSPGLINSHDHLTFQAPPYVVPAGKPADERYEHRHDWRIGGASHDNHTKVSSGGTATNFMVQWAELRQLMSGTTAIVGATDGRPGLLRNLDSANNQEGLYSGTQRVNSETFPLGDQSGAEITSGCGYPGIDSPTAIPANSAYLPHVSEGIEQSAHCSSRRMFIDPEMTQSLPSAMRTPMRA